MVAASSGTQRPPSAVRLLVGLLAVTAVATVAIDLLNWWYAPDRDFAMAVRSGWAMLRALGFVILVWQVRRGRPGARPFGLILAVTTIFAIGRLVVPRSGVPPLAGALGFGLLAGLCVAVVWLLYRSPGVRAHLVRHPARLVFDGGRPAWRAAPPRRPPVAGWLLVARVSAFTYAPLMLVPALVSIGVLVDGRLGATPVVLGWLAVGFATSYVVLLISFFLLRGSRWARRLLVAFTIAVVAVDLPLCWWLLGVDGLIRDGTPLVSAGALAVYGVWRAGRAETTMSDGAGSPATDPE
ncbi:hypothetical protein O7632_27710 [Solwaraspora sp. WMMD406]|uniref:hypothetical protein n=1 Tax=Solwaraspora sp. WMMD406 TaxID=3016095 RepID=UPI002416746D|nr:hypothetical protein [Solwaraspora sp. WMMD406]MDG4767852.1 hypothetical protein [Solwaraspora sp. WMMD406]